ncbi:hypothetical protein CQ12_26350 [Bradyrhizobium jicamae]|uniref:Uncharacterized protein n=1 Tax=Bradyrhizobium jicamae TaxID=280332 RepID=A0A0R3L1E6_9BRAD|nr:hypothetical protein CQ12_26350 [Bradyrhizobium jicamae]
MMVVEIAVPLLAAPFLKFSALIVATMIAFNSLPVSWPRSCCLKHFPFWRNSFGAYVRASRRDFPENALNDLDALLCLFFARRSQPFPPWLPVFEDAND